MFEYMIEFLTSTLVAKSVMVAGVGIVGGLLSWLLKKYIRKDTLNERLDEWLDKTVGPWVDIVFGGPGRLFTKAAVNWPVIGPIWNKVIEPLLIILINLPAKVILFVVDRARKAFVNGLLSDNPNFRDETKTEKATSVKIELPKIKKR